MEKGICEQCSFFEVDGFCILHGEEAADVPKCESYETPKEQQQFLTNRKNNNN